MHPAIRTQVDDQFEEYSNAIVTACPPGEDRARQEDKASTDIRNIMSRFEPHAPARVAQWGRDIDYGVDLQTALESASAAQRAHLKISPELREKYPTWQSLLNGLVSGEFKLDLEGREEVPPEEEPEVPAPAPGIRAQ